MTRQRLHLPLLVLAVGALVTLFHEYLYARVGGDQFYIFGLISHGGIDMALSAIASVLTVTIYSFRRSAP